MSGPECKAPGWRRFWTGYVVVASVVGVVGDTVAYVRCGWDATLTAAIRKWTGLEPATRYGRLGRVALLGFLSWAACHLGFGILGPSSSRK